LAVFNRKRLQSKKLLLLYNKHLTTPTYYYTVIHLEKEKEKEREGVEKERERGRERERERARENNDNAKCTILYFRFKVTNKKNRALNFLLFVCVAFSRKKTSSKKIFQKKNKTGASL
jgi:hypothetical protein